MENLRPLFLSASRMSQEYPATSIASATTKELTSQAP
jgi:hypothetical protein